MQAVTLREPGQLSAITLPEAEAPGPGEALVAVRRIGICGTDLHAFHGQQPFFNYPRILGHELGVEVLEVGEGVVNVRRGDRAALRPYLECGTCDACRRGLPNCCTELAVLGAHIDGGMRERMVVPADHLHSANGLTFDQLALVETLSIGGHAVRRGAPTSDDRVLVVGAGPIGLSVTAFMRQMGNVPLISDLSRERRTFAESWIAAPTIGAADDISAELRGAFGGELPTLVFDATGNASSMARAFELVAHGGRLVFVGLVQGDIAFRDQEFHRREITLLASRNAAASDFERSIALLESGVVDVSAWMTDRCSLADVASTLPGWTRGGTSTIKPIVEIDG